MVLFYIIGGYVAASVLFLRYPTLLHKKKKHKFRAVHISHRGGAAENLENTMAAFHHAQSLGTDMLEIDCQLTKDGVVVVSHDNDLLRVTGQGVAVSETLFKDLPHLKAQLRPDFYWAKAVASGTDRKIPSLEEVMSAFPNMPLNVDIKVDNDQLISKVADLIRKYKRDTITVWGSRSSNVTKKCFLEHPDVGLFFSANRILTIIALFYTGLLPFVPIRETHFEMVMPSIAFKEGVFAFQLSWKWKFLLRLINFLVMNRLLFQHLQARGIEIYLWVLNDEDDYHKAFAYGANGIMTDCPTKLIEFLKKNPQNQQMR